MGSSYLVSTLSHTITLVASWKIKMLQGFKFIAQAESRAAEFQSEVAVLTARLSGAESAAQAAQFLDGELHKAEQQVEVVRRELQDARATVSGVARERDQLQQEVAYPLAPISQLMVFFKAG